MSTDKDMYPERESVLILKDENLDAVHYDSLIVGKFYTVRLVSGAYSIYKKSNLFDDDLIKKVKTREEAVSSLTDASRHG